MEITLIIVAGLSLITAITMVGDYLTKTKLARSSVDPQLVAEMQQRIEALERQLADQGSKVAQLSHDVEFTTRLLEGKE